MASGERPTFRLQYDHDASQKDQTTPDDTNSHEMSTMPTEHNNRLNAGYSSVKPSDTINMNSNGYSKLNYSHTGSHINDNAAPNDNYDNGQTCNANEIIDMSDNHNSKLIKYANYSEMLRELGQESKMVLLQYSQVFADSEGYEQQTSQTITDLTAHAQLLLQTLNEHKKILCRRITSISEALKHEG